MKLKLYICEYKNMDTECLICVGLYIYSVCVNLSVLEKHMSPFFQECHLF